MSINGYLQYIYKHIYILRMCVCVPLAVKSKLRFAKICM